MITFVSFQLVHLLLGWAHRAVGLTGTLQSMEAKNHIEFRTFLTPVDRKQTKEDEQELKGSGKTFYKAIDRSWHSGTAVELERTVSNSEWIETSCIEESIS